MPNDTSTSPTSDTASTDDRQYVAARHGAIRSSAHAGSTSAHGRRTSQQDLEHCDPARRGLVMAAGPRCGSGTDFDPFDVGKQLNAVTRAVGASRHAGASIGSELIFIASANFFERRSTPDAVTDNTRMEGRTTGPTGAGKENSADSTPSEVIAGISTPERDGPDRNDPHEGMLKNGAADGTLTNDGIATGATTHMTLGNKPAVTNSQPTIDCNGVKAEFARWMRANGWAARFLPMDKSLPTSADTRSNLPSTTAHSARENDGNGRSTTEGNAHKDGLSNLSVAGRSTDVSCTLSTSPAVILEKGNLYDRWDAARTLADAHEPETLADHDTSNIEIGVEHPRASADESGNVFSPDGTTTHGSWVENASAHDSDTTDNPPLTTAAWLDLYDPDRIIAWVGTIVMAIAEKENWRIASIRLDLDEKTPHLSVFVVPTYTKKTKHTRKLCVSVRHHFDKLRQLIGLQDWIGEVCAPIGLVRGQRSSETKVRHCAPTAWRAFQRQVREAEATMARALGEMKRAEALMEATTELMTKADARMAVAIDKEKANAEKAEELARREEELLERERAATDAEVALMIKHNWATLDRYALRRREKKTRSKEERLDSKARRLAAEREALRARSHDVEAEWDLLLKRGDAVQNIYDRLCATHARVGEAVRLADDILRVIETGGIDLDALGLTVDQYRPVEMHDAAIGSAGDLDELGSEAVVECARSVLANAMRRLPDGGWGVERQRFNDHLEVWASQRTTNSQDHDSSTEALSM